MDNLHPFNHSTMHLCETAFVYYFSKAFSIVNMPNFLPTELEFALQNKGTFSRTLIDSIALSLIKKLLATDKIVNWQLTLSHLIDEHIKINKFFVKENKFEKLLIYESPYGFYKIHSTNKIKILKNICDWLIEENEQIRQEAKDKFNGEVTLLKLAQPCIGKDSQENSYFCTNSSRIYKISKKSNSWRALTSKKDDLLRFIRTLNNGVNEEKLKNVLENTILPELDKEKINEFRKEKDYEINKVALERREESIISIVRNENKTNDIKDNKRKREIQKNDTKNKRLADKQRNSLRLDKVTSTTPKVMRNLRSSDRNSKIDTINLISDDEEGTEEDSEVENSDYIFSYDTSNNKTLNSTKKINEKKNNIDNDIFSKENAEPNTLNKKDRKNRETSKRKKGNRLSNQEKQIYENIQNTENKTNNTKQNKGSVNKRKYYNGNNNIPMNNNSSDKSKTKTLKTQNSNLKNNFNNIIPNDNNQLIDNGEDENECETKKNVKKQNNYNPDSAMDVEESIPTEIPETFNYQNTNNDNEIQFNIPHNFGKNNYGINNKGNGNYGDNNIGNSNIGDNNDGNNNKGNNNSGNNNIGNNNRGNNNIGNNNVGNNNFGDNNEGDNNEGVNNNGYNNNGNNNSGNNNNGSNNDGDNNNGNHNRGDNNNGHSNEGNNNNGNCNRGDNNNGDNNVGNNNNGYNNIGNNNDGNCNKGNNNNGNFNKGDHHNGNSNEDFDINSENNAYELEEDISIIDKNNNEPETLNSITHNVENEQNTESDDVTYYNIEETLDLDSKINNEIPISTIME